MTLRALIPFFAAILGVALLFWSFLSGISAALDGSGSGSLFWQIIFVLTAIALIVLIVLSIVSLVKKRAIVISVATLLVAVIPLIVIVILAVLALQPVGMR